jgi:hypothetical protein
LVITYGISTFDVKGAAGDLVDLVHITEVRVQVRSGLHVPTKPVFGSRKFALHPFEVLLSSLLLTSNDIGNRFLVDSLDGRVLRFCNLTRSPFLQFLALLCEALLLDDATDLCRRQTQLLSDFARGQPTQVESANVCPLNVSFPNVWHNGSGGVQTYRVPLCPSTH